MLLHRVVSRMHRDFRTILSRIAAHCAIAAQAFF
jgi:hypothetical protein